MGNIELESKGDDMGTAIVLIVIVAIVVGIVKGMIKEHKNGKSIHCGGSCNHCGGSCHLKKDN